MTNFDFYAPTYFAFGKDRENDAGKLVKRFGGTKVLLHYGGGSVIRSGLLDKVKKLLNDENIPYTELGGVQPNPRSGLVYKGIEICKNEGIDFVLAVGGGSTIDSSKAIAAGTVYDGDFWDFYEGKPVENALPVGTVLTIAAAGSEGSPDSVITKEEGMLKRGASGEAYRPRFSILNPALTQTLPPYQTACGITDIICHLYERYLTNTTSVETTDRMIEGLILAMITEGPKVMKNPDDYEARANIMWAGMMAHNNSCGIGRSQDWTSHNLEHELSAKYDCAHGAGLAVAMPAVFRYTMKHDINRFAKIAVRVWGCQMDFECPENTALLGIERLRQFLISIGMPVTFEELGANASDIPELTQKALTHGDTVVKTLNGFTELTAKDIENIYGLML